MERVAQLPGVADYLSTRPPLDQLGKHVIAKMQQEAAQKQQQT